MNGTETALVQIFGYAISTGTLVAVFKWLLPKMMEVAASIYTSTVERNRAAAQEKAENERKNIQLQIDLENAKRLNQEQAIKHTADTVVVLRQTVGLMAETCSDIKIGLKATNDQIGRILSYQHLWEELRVMVEQIKKNNMARLAKYPEQEHIHKGDTTVIRKKPDGAEG